MSTSNRRGGDEPLADRMRVQPLFELIDVGVLVLDAPAHVDRRAQDGDAKGPVGLLDGHRVVVHAELIGDKRLAE